MPNDICVILNPRAGQGNLRFRDQVTGTLHSAGIAFDLLETTRPGHATELALAARCNGHRLVIAVGGDGTVNEVINGLAQAAAEGETVGTLGLYPIGTGNDFADMVGISRKANRIVQQIAAGRTRHIDLGRATLKSADQEVVRYFGNNVGLGFEAQVTLESYKIKRIQGAMRYLLAVFRALRNYDSPQVEVRWERPAGGWEERIQPALMVSVGNSRRTGGAFYLTPDASMDDGYLDLAIAKALSTFGILRLLPKVMLAAHRNDPSIEFARSRHITFSCTATVPVHLDGEVIMSDVRQADIELLPGRLEVLI